MSYLTDPKGMQFSLFQTDNNLGDQTMCGQRFHTEDGREVVLVNNGLVALTSGVLIQHSPIVATDQTLTTVSYSPVNPQTNLPAQIVVTSGGTVATSQYQGGFAIVKSGTGAGQTLRISNNTASTVSNPLTITLEDQPVVALDATSVINLIAAPYTAVVINPTTATASPAAVTLYPIPASVGTLGTLTYAPQYGFALVQGITAGLNQGGTAVGLGLEPSTSVAGALATVAATGNQVASAYQAGVDTDYGAVFVNL